MFLYCTLGTNDLARAKRFYDAALAPLGITCLENGASEIGYGPAEGATQLWIVPPFDGRPASVGNGSMPAFAARNRAAVDAFHAAGLAAGGSDEGAPGLRRYGPNFYAAYLRDPDGNKLSAVFDHPE